MTRIISFRAECLRDVDCARGALHLLGIRPKQFKIWGDPQFPDATAEVEFNEDLDLNRFKQTLAQWIDTHVIIDTVRPCSLKDNSLERDFSDVQLDEPIKPLGPKEWARMAKRLKENKPPRGPLITAAEINDRFYKAYGKGVEGAPRQWTNEEACERFVEHSLGIAKEWASYTEKTPRDRCEGVVFSMLAMIDGSNVGSPAFNLTPRIDPTDKEWAINNECNYYEDQPINEYISLHDLYHKILDERLKKKFD